MDNSARGGIGIAGLLTVIFIILKVSGKIDWPWVWVLSPLWISAIVGIVLILVILSIFRPK